MAQDPATDAAPPKGDGRLQQTDLFVSGRDGYHTYRIPALVVSAKGTILAFCEGRKHSRSDAGTIHLLLKRSMDHGRTWQATQLLVEDGDMTCGNPCPVVDPSNGAIWLPFCKNDCDRGLDLITEARAPRTAWMTSSTDDGATWAVPVEITQDVKDPSWTWYATGPGHGIALRSGRLLIPCDHIVRRNSRRDDPHRSHVMYSDDHGRRWHIGGVVGEGTDECEAVEAADGAVYINCRNYAQPKKRAYAWSRDRGETFSERAWHDELIEPICQASLVRFTEAGPHDRNRVLFANPASTEREKMTIRVSYDECRTWPVARLLHEGPAAYSDLAVAADMSICCLYERGEQDRYERLTFAQFDLDWLTHGTDRLSGRAGQRQAPLSV